VPQNDFGINGHVRRVLAKRWVRSETLEIGVTEGVVLLKGFLDLEPGGGIDLADGDARARFMRRLRSDLLGISGVTDVVMDLHSSEETAARWMRTGN
jgi:hypothetical protein